MRIIAKLDTSAVTRNSRDGIGRTISVPQSCRVTVVSPARRILETPAVARKKDERFFIVLKAPSNPSQLHILRYEWCRGGGRLRSESARGGEGEERITRERERVCGTHKSHNSAGPKKSKTVRRDTGRRQTNRQTDRQTDWRDANHDAFTLPELPLFETAAFDRFDQLKESKVAQWFFFTFKYVTHELYARPCCGTSHTGKHEAKSLYNPASSDKWDEEKVRTQICSKCNFTGIK